MNTAEFLSSFFAEKPEDAFILIWTKKEFPAKSKSGKPEIEKSSIWFQSVEDAAKVVDQLRTYDVYFGVGTSPKDYGPKNRCIMENISGIYGLWIDIDIADGGHKKKNLPDSIEEARELLDECPLKPTYLIHSGGGLQAYWQFVKPVIIAGPEAEDLRGIIYHLEQTWNYYFKALAKPHGWDIDSVFDLARVMRLPGSFNCKLDDRRPVVILDHNDLRYKPEKLLSLAESVIPPEKPKKGAAPPPEPVEIDLSKLPDRERDFFTLDPAATYDPDLFDSMVENEPKFMATWQHKRKDFQDQSLSTYDMSLIGITLRAGWPTQEIVNLVTHHRRKYGDEKTDETTGQLRRDYYDRSLKNARDFMNKNGGADNIPTNAEARGPVEGETRKTILEQLSERLGCNIRSISRIMEDTPYFRLTLSDGVSIDLGDAGGILNATTFRNKVATASKIAIPRFKADKWDNLASRLISCANDERPDPLETSAGFARYYLQGYLLMKTPVAHTDAEAVEGHPFFWNKKVYVTLAKFQEWLTMRKIGLKNYSTALKSIGCSQEVRHVGPTEQSTTRSCWLVPDEYYNFIFVEKPAAE